jgi:5-methylcytosine-specific restriction endonuclease McrA
MFQGQFYWEDEGYTEEEVTALILDREDRKERRVSSAIARVEMRDDPSALARQVIPEDVKLFVWKRDGGKCVRCGSRENLEYDHIIPVAKGGSSTARNLQLLCESCNRAKGSNLV